ncbi:hypothetical protein [Bremerella cremea]|uniref:hypothetical protein n=1 Tax=Bremerella cremea TaxID=1031537 RepID=UPI0031E93AB2
MLLLKKIILFSLVAIIVASRALDLPAQAADEEKSFDFNAGKTGYVQNPGGTFSDAEIARGESVQYLGLPSKLLKPGVKEPEPTDADLALISRFPKLRILSMWGKSVTKEGIAQLAKCQKLTSYRHAGLENSDELVPVLCQACPQLVDLQLPNCDLTDKSADAIAKLEKLEQLELRGTKITNEFFMGRTFSNDITRVDLLQTGVDSQVIAHLPPNVTSLDLSGTKVDGKSLPELLKRKNLKYLELPFYNFSPDEQEALSRQLPNTMINGHRYAD